MVKYYNGEMYTILKEFEAEVRADERKKFAEWCKAKGYGCYDWSMLIEQYEREQQKGDQT